MNTILITGGTGFVGGHVTELLLQKASRIIVSYRTLDPYSYFLMNKFQNKVTMLNLDVVNINGVIDATFTYEVDYIIHLAAQAIVTTAYENPVEALKTNIMGTISVLEAARLNKRIKGVIVASSDKAYGKKGQIKYVEKDPLRGDHPYEVSKSSADQIAYTYFKTYKVPVIITRFGNIYGEGDLNYNRIIPGLIKSVIQKKPLILRSDGTFVRDYVHVKDVARAYITLLTKFENLSGEAFNFSSKEKLSVLEIITLAEKTIHQKIPYLIKNNSINEISYQSLDDTKARKLLKYNNLNTLAKSLPLLVAWYKKNMS